MIYLNAQPDRNYFIWQLLVQQTNFKRVGINPKDVHCLIGFKGTVNPEWTKYNWEFNLHFIEDNRESNGYKPSLRPHLIKQFLIDRPNDDIFYYDADIIFREQLDFNKLQDKVYFSKAYYVGYKYVHDKNIGLLSDMAQVIGVEPKDLKDTDHKAGGAQYYFPKGSKPTTVAFWDEVERLCEKLQQKYNFNEDKYRKEWALDHTDPWDFQIWPIDMFVINWMLVRDKVEFDVTPELEFSWPTENLFRWNETKIFHNSGITGQVGFLHKQQYETHFPDRINIDQYNKDACQIYYIKEVIDTFQSTTVKKNKEESVTPVTIDIEEEKTVTFVYLFNGSYTKLYKAIKQYDYQISKNKANFLVVNTTPVKLELLNYNVVNSHNFPFDDIIRNFNTTGTFIEWTTSMKSINFLDLYV